MTALQTEPFAKDDGPFATVQTEIAPDFPSDYVDVATENRTEVVFAEDVGRKPRLCQMTVYLPDDVHARLLNQIECERRLMRVVMDKCVSDFLENDAEPRPYLPAVFSGKMCHFTVRISPDLKDRLYRRAWIEGRAAVTLMQRAILDYLEANEPEAVE